MTTIEITDRGFGQKHDVQLGDDILIRLPENPTTGFRWQLLTSGDGGLQAVDDSFEPSGASPPPGSAGHRVFRFTASHRGTVLLSLVYKRAWEPGDNQKREIFLNIRERS